ncbi:MAG: S1C family serine protease, partial [Spartobacteria bacterium]
MLLRAAFNFPARLAVLATASLVAMPMTRSHAAEPSLAENITCEIQRIFEQNRKAVVRVQASDSMGVRLGSGFFIDPTGLIYTHAGVVLNAGNVTVTFNGTSLPARVLTADERSGIALLQADCISPFIRIGDSRNTTVATPVLAIGFPEDRESSASLGMIAGHDRQHMGQYFSTTHIRANMPVSRGEGGAPVLNLNGEAIGIVVARINEGGSCHILPIRAAEKIRNDIARYGDLRHGWVGVEVEDAPEPVNGTTAKITALNPAANAADQGLQPGDMVNAIGTTPVASSEDVVDASYFLTAGEPANIQITRNGQSLNIQVTPKSPPLT